jgi:hypothetical protein
MRALPVSTRDGKRDMILLEILASVVLLVVILGALGIYRRWVEMPTGNARMHS